MFDGKITWKCLDCGESRVSHVAHVAQVTCPHCGGKQLKATHANPSRVRLRLFTRDRLLDWGMDLLLEAQR